MINKNSNPWVQILGGTTTFGALSVSSVFRFPVTDLLAGSPTPGNLTKVSTRCYQDVAGRKFSTGAGTMVVVP